MLHHCLSPPLPSSSVGFTSSSSSRSFVNPASPLRRFHFAPFAPVHGFSIPHIALPKRVRAAVVSSGSDPAAVASHSSDSPVPLLVNKVIARAIGATVLLAWWSWGGRAMADAGTQMMVASSSGGAVGGKDVVVSAWMGLMAGCLHTLTGPDHLAALAPLSIACRSTLESIAVGALWGCGHDAGQVLFGLLFLLLKDKLHIHVLRTWGARVVGITLLTIGALGLKEAQESAAAAALPAMPYIASSTAKFHAAKSYSLPPPAIAKSSNLGVVKKNLGFATFATGIVHGLQPDALIMILPALALPSRVAGAAFLTMFLVGTVVAMSGYTAFLNSCSHALKKRIPRINEVLGWVSSLVAIFVGVAILAGELLGLSIL